MSTKQIVKKRKTDLSLEKRQMKAHSVYTKHKIATECPVLLVSLFSWGEGSKYSHAPLGIATTRYTNNNNVVF